MHQPEYRHITNERLNALVLTWKELNEVSKAVTASKLFSAEFLGRLQTADMLLRYGAGMPLELHEADTIKQKLMEQIKEGTNRF